MVFIQTEKTISNNEAPARGTPRRHLSHRMQNMRERGERASAVEVLLREAESAGEAGTALLGGALQLLLQRRRQRVLERTLHSPGGAGTMRSKGKWV